MATGGVLGIGSRVGYSAASPVAWTRVLAIMDIAWPTETAGEVNITTHDTTGKYEKSMPGMTKVNNPSFTVLADPDPATSPDQAALEAAQKVGTKLWWHFERPTDRARTTFRGVEFEAAVLSAEPGVPIGGAQTTKYTLVFQGEGLYQDFAVGASSF